MKKLRLSNVSLPVLAFCSLSAGLTAFGADPVPTAIVEIKRDTPVDFQKEVLPILAKNCTACHNAQKAESGLVLETPQTILKGGDSGPAVVPKDGQESLLLQVAAHQSEPLMPPEANTVDAKKLTGEQLGLIKLWIDQGATGEVNDRVRRQVGPAAAERDPQRRPGDQHRRSARLLDRVAALTAGSRRPLRRRRTSARSRARTRRGPCRCRRAWRAGRG